MSFFVLGYPVSGPISIRAEVLLISRPGACGGFVLVFWWRPAAALAHNHACHIKKGTCKVQVSEAACKHLKPPMCALCSLQKSGHANGRVKNCVGLLSSWRGGFAPDTIQEALTEDRKILSCLSQASVRSLPSSCLCPY